MYWRNICENVYNYIKNKKSTKKRENKNKSFNLYVVEY